MASFGQPAATPLNAPTSNVFAQPPTSNGASPMTSVFANASTAPANPFATATQSSPLSFDNGTSVFGNAALAASSASASNPFAAFAKPAPSSNTASVLSGGINAGGPISNPFAHLLAPAASAPVANPFATTATATANPFATAATSTSASAPNLFATAPSGEGQTISHTSAAQPASTTTTNPFESASTATKGLFAPTPTSSSTASYFLDLLEITLIANPFANFLTNGASKRKNEFDEESNSKRRSPSPLQPKQLASVSAPGDSAALFTTPTPRKGNAFLDNLKAKGISVEDALATTNSNDNDTSPEVYARNIHDALRKAKLTPPKWPAEPGNPANINIVEDHRQAYKKYEAKVRTCLIKAGLIDDPDVRKKLSDAIDFRGVCEEMCPEGEKISRIVEYDVKAAEKTASPDGLSQWASPDLMVKAFKRSAAGMEAPLPISVRSPAALRRTVDYLMDDLLKNDENLPSLHNFLWDRTRAVRKDFIFQSAMSPGERKDQIYCLENIARFHVTALHLLSEEGVAAEDFSQQQELEQLGKTLLSLMQAYDDCKGMDIENEAEFRAYHILFHAHDTAIKQKILELDEGFWFKSKEVQTALTLVEALQNTWSGRGPLKPNMPLTTASSSFSTYFSIVEQPEVSYTMACFAEVHFAELRMQILRAINKSYGRVRDMPKDLTPEVVNEFLRFDTIEQCVSFVEDLGLEWASESPGSFYLVVDRKKSISNRTIRQTASQKIVERKRGGRPLPEAIHETLYNDGATEEPDLQGPDSLFVKQSPVLPPAPSAAITRPKSPIKAASPFDFGNALKSAQSANIINPAASKTTPIINPFATATAAKSAFPATLEQQTTRPLFPVVNTANPTLSSPPASTVVKPTETPSLFAAPKTPQLFPFPPSAPAAQVSGLPSSVPSAETSPPDRPLKKSVQIDLTANTTKIIDNSAPPAAAASTASSAPANTTIPSNPINNNVGLFAPKSALKTDVTKLAASPMAPPSPPKPPRDMMGDLTKWVVLGDTGLMDMFQEAMVESCLRGLFDKHQKDEAERMRKEEDEQSWAEAMKFRTYSLGLKFFYRWQKTARSLAMRKLAQNSKQAMKAYREGKLQEAKAAKEQAILDEKARLKRLGVPSKYLDDLARERAAKRTKLDSETSSRRGSDASTTREGWNALLATNVLDGIDRDRVISRMEAEDDKDSLYEALVGSQSKINGDMAPPPPKHRRDPLHTTRNGGVTKSYKPRESLKAQRLRALMAGKALPDNVSIASNSTRDSSLRRSFNSFNVSPPVTNFSKYAASTISSNHSSIGSASSRPNGVKSNYWRLKARGLVTMPNGAVLHEKMAIPMMKHGVRYEGIGDYGLGPGSGVDGKDATQDAEADDAIQRGRTRIPDVLRRQSAGSTVSRSVSRDDSRARLERIRQTYGTGSGRRLGNGSPPGRLTAEKLKRIDTLTDPAATTAKNIQRAPASTQESEADKILREFREAADALDDDTSWYRDQIGQLREESSLDL